MNSPFYATCLSLVDSSLRLRGKRRRLHQSSDESDIASGDLSYAASLPLSPGLRAGSYTVVVSYMQWTGAAGSARR